MDERADIATFFYPQFKEEKLNNKKWLPPQNKLSISVCFGIGATIRIGQQIQCLPYAGFDASLMID